MFNGIYFLLAYLPQDSNLDQVRTIWKSSWLCLISVILMTKQENIETKNSHITKHDMEYHLTCKEFKLYCKLFNYFSVTNQVCKLCENIVIFIFMLNFSFINIGELDINFTELLKKLSQRQLVYRYKKRAICCNTFL